MSPISLAEVAKAIDFMHSGKACDANGLAAEHLKFANTWCLKLLTSLLQANQSHLHSPQSTKGSTLGMLGRKAKNLMHMTNYRGISITDLLGKMFDTVQEKRRLSQGVKQSPLQFGFTKGLSPTMAALILSEAITDAKENHKDLYIVSMHLVISVLTILSFLCKFISNPNIIIPYPFENEWYSPI